MFEFFRKSAWVPCPVCFGRGQITVERIWEKCVGCEGTGWTKETSERTDLNDE